MTSEYLAYRNAANEDTRKLQDAIELAKVEREQLQATAEKVFT